MTTETMLENAMDMKQGIKDLDEVQTKSHEKIRQAQLQSQLKI